MNDYRSPYHAFLISLNASLSTWCGIVALLLQTLDDEYTAANKDFSLGDKTACCLPRPAA
jgi:hypothetical protein